MTLFLSKSPRQGKKYLMRFPDGTSTHFGATTYRDFTLINDAKSKHYIKSKADREKVRQQYQGRHKNDLLNDPTSAGALSWYILWTAPTLAGAIKNYEKRFDVKVKRIT